MKSKYRLQGKQIVNICRQTQQLYISSLLIMVATCFGHSLPSSGQLIETLGTISVYLCIFDYHIIYIKMYIKFKILKVVHILKYFCRNSVLVTNFPHYSYAGALLNKMAPTVVNTILLVKGRKDGNKAKYLQEENNLDDKKNYVHPNCLKG
jgi:hypothetical protein